MDDDFLLAIRLQEQYDQEAEGQPWRSSSSQETRPKDLSIVDPSWELLDPSPDIHALFLQFNQMFFWGKLLGVEVKWSPKMTLCAGVCSYEGRGGLCSIRLSKPLLTLRPRKDLVQTLLHEMIHALLFVTHNNKDRDSHGPEFLKHMNRINALTGTEISVYHSFHDEVNEYRKHWWRCNGPCQSRKPYFGYVKRAMNRAPSARDPWWPEHQRTCGGTYTKVKEPEPSSHKDQKKKETVSESHAKNKTQMVWTSQSKNKTEMVSASQVKNKTEMVSASQSKNKTEMVSASQVKNTTIEKTEGIDIRTFMPFSGKGYKLGESSKSLGSGKVQNAVPSSLELSKPMPKNLINGILNFTTSSAKTQNKDSSFKVPKISVANTKMFINVGGSPVKLPFRSRNEAPLSSKSNSSINVTQKRLSSEMLTSPQSTPSTSRDTNGDELYGRAPKRPKVDGSQDIKHFFPNVTGFLITATKSATSVPSDQQRSTNESITSSQKKVNCPVCQAEVPEVKINDHLDTCLS